jgi:hypothetical protein
VGARTGHCEFRESDNAAREQLVHFVLSHQETPTPAAGSNKRAA